MHGAPVRPREPPTTTTLPELNLVESTPRRGMSRSTPGVISPASASPGAPRGMPMSITVTAPACALPGAIQRPGFARWKVAVAAARTATPGTSPVLASTPLGMSAAITLPLAPEISSIARATGSFGAPLEPVPSRASTMPCALASSAAS